MKYEPKDVPQFQEDVCKKTCIMKGKCISDGQNNHWFLMCPHYHQWKLGYEDNFVQKQITWEQEHPEEAKAKHDALVQRAKEWKASQRKRKTNK